MKRPLAPVLVSLAVLLGAAPALRAAERVLTPEDVARIRAVTQVAMAPDGAKIAYVLSVPRIPFAEPDGRSWSELHVVDLEGNDRTFVGGKTNVGSIEWTPDGKAITFLAKRDGDEHKAIYSIPFGGGESKKLVEHTTDITAYSWSDKGDAIAFIAAAPKDEALAKMKEKGFDALVFEERDRFSTVWIARPETDEPHRQVEVSGQPSELHISPDGTKLALALAPSPRIDDDYMNRAVHVLDATTGATLTRWPNHGKLGDIVWSPDSEQLAILSAVNRNDPSEGRVYVTLAQGADAGETPEWTELLPDHEGHVTAVRWNTSNALTALVDEGCTTAVYMLRVEGRVSQLIESDAYVFTGLSLAGNGRAGAAVCHTKDHPPEVYVATRADPRPTRLTDSNPWLADVRLAPQEVVTFNARDGLELQGILIHPLDEQEGRRYPLILTVHGGPESHDTNGWVTRYAAPGQVGAARGYAIFHPNYRGSTGRGVAFSQLGQGDYAGKEFDDLVDAVDHLVETGLVDKDKVGVTGGSYGGYASAWCATKLTDRFAAAVMFVGISNNISKNGTTDIPQEMELVHARMNVIENLDFLLERSPIRWVQQAHTPILILAGQDDPRVHPEQSMELYRQLKNQGKVPVRLIYYPGEGHGNQRAASRYDYNLRMLQWFDTYLKGPGGAPPAPDLDYPLEKAEAGT